MKKHYYQAYGFTLISDFEIEAFQKVEKPSNSDNIIDLKVGIVNFDGHDFIDDFVIREHTDQGFLYVIKKKIATLINGNVITIQPLTGNIMEWQSYLVGGVMSILLMQKGYFLLHGSAVHNGQEACLFLGVSGVGKSSLATGLIQKGYEVITDDICALSAENNRCTINPGTNQLRLLKDAADKLNLKDMQPIGYPLEKPKYGYKFCSESFKTKYEVKKIIELLIDPNIEAEISLEEVSSFNEIEIINSNQYKADLAQKVNSIDTNFQLAVNSTIGVDFFKIKRRRKDFGLLDLVNFVEDKLLY